MRSPTRPRLVVLLASAMLAAAAFAAMAQPSPGDPLAAAQAAVDAGDSQRALDLVGPILKREPRNARALLVRSTARCIDGDLDACRADLDRALKLDPKLRQGWLNRSALAIADGRYDDALAALREAERLDPAAPDNAINQGAVELLRGDLEAASGQFKRYLTANPNSAPAWYLVASNYARAGYAALALQHLERAIALDERSRAEARTDPNFADLATNRSFQQLLATDSFTPAAGSLVAEKRFASRYRGSDSPVLVAILNALQLSGAHLDPRVEVTPDWALLWSDFRIKLARGEDDTTWVRLSAPPGSFSAAAWKSRSDALFAEVESQLLRLELAAGSAKQED